MLCFDDEPLPLPEEPEAFFPSTSEQYEFRDDPLSKVVPDRIRQIAKYSHGAAQKEVLGYVTEIIEPDGAIRREHDRSVVEQELDNPKTAMLLRYINIYYPIEGGLRKTII